MPQMCIHSQDPLVQQATVAPLLLVVTVVEPRHHNQRSVGTQQSSHHFSFVTSYTHIISQLLPSQSQGNPYKRPKVCHESFLDDDGSSEGEVAGTHLTSANSEQYPHSHCKSVYSYHSECNSAKLP